MPLPVETFAHAIERVRKLGENALYMQKLATVYAVVFECEQPRRTKGTDFVVNMQLADASMHSEEGLQQVELIIFSPSVDYMPQAQPGDVIELRNVVVNFRASSGGTIRPQLFGKLSPPHNFGYVVYRPTQPDAAAAAQPVHMHNITRIFEQVKAEKLTALWPLASRLSAPMTAAERTNPHMRRIKDLEPPEDLAARPDCVDIRVQILAIDKRNADEQVVLFVWDGTDAKPLPADLTMHPSVWRDVDLIVEHPGKQVMPTVSQPDVDVINPVPSLGSAVPVIIARRNLLPTPLPAVGSWVKLKIVGLLAVQGQMQLVFGPSSKLALAQPAAVFEQTYKERMDNNRTSEWPLVEAQDSNVVTWCSRQDLLHTTIRQVHQQALQHQPGPFRVLLRLVGYFPGDLKQWCKQVPGRPEDDGAAGGVHTQQHWEWAAHLLLADATGELRALLLGREATRLLGLPPTDLSTSEENVQQLQQRLDALSAVDQYGGTWMDVAITPVYQQQQHSAAQAAGQQQQGLEQMSQQQTGQQGDDQQPRGQSASEQAPDSPVANSNQQQQSAQQHGQMRSRVSGSSRSSSGTSRECLFILHDAVCPNMQAQEEHEQQHQEPQQEQQGPLQQQAQAHTTSEEASPKRQRREEPAAEVVAPASQPATQSPVQVLSPASQLARDRREAMAFM